MHSKKKFNKSANTSNKNVTPGEIVQNNVAIEAVIENLEFFVKTIKNSDNNKLMQHHYTNLSKFKNLILDMSLKEEQTISFCCVQLEAAENAIREVSTISQKQLQLKNAILTNIKTILTINKKLVTQNSREKLSKPLQEKFKQAEAKGLTGIEQVLSLALEAACETGMIPSHKEQFELVRNQPALLSLIADEIRPTLSNQPLQRNSLPSLKELCVNKILPNKNAYYFSLWKLPKGLIEEYPMLEVDYQNVFTKTVTNILQQYTYLDKSEKYKALYKQIKKINESFAHNNYNLINIAIKQFKDPSKNPEIKKGFRNEKPNNFVSDLIVALNTYSEKHKEHLELLQEQTSMKKS